MVFSQRISSALRPTATSFNPGALQHVAKKISWHPLGITACRRFTVVQNEALIRGRTTSFAKGLHKTHASPNRNSKIRDADPHGAAPFTIPPNPDRIHGGIAVAEILEEGADTLNMIKCTAVKLETVGQACDVNLPLVHHESEKFDEWSVNDYMSWISESESAPPGVTAETVHLGRINTIKGVPVSWSTEAVDLRTPHNPVNRLNHCDN